MAKKSSVDSSSVLFSLIRLITDSIALSMISPFKVTLTQAAILNAAEFAKMLSYALYLIVYLMRNTYKIRRA